MRENKEAEKLPPSLCILMMQNQKVSFLYIVLPYICSEKRKITKISKLPTIQEGYFRKNYKNLVKEVNRVKSWKAGCENSQPMKFCRSRKFRNPAKFLQCSFPSVFCSSFLCFFYLQY